MKKKNLKDRIAEIFGLKKQGLTFWQLRGRKCKTCEITHKYCGKKAKNRCCKEYKPKKGRN